VNICMSEVDHKVTTNSNQDCKANRFQAMVEAIKSLRNSLVFFVECEKSLNFIMT